MEIGNKIMDLRKKMGMTQETLADKLGVSRQTISKWELGETSPDLEQAKNLSQIFQISLDDLVGNDIQNILITKVSNTEKLAGMIIKIFKICGIILCLLFLGIIASVVCFTYFDVEVASETSGIHCKRDEQEYFYEVTTYPDEPNVIQNFATSDKKIKKEMNIRLEDYNNPEILLEDVREYIISHGGSCGT